VTKKRGTWHNIMNAKKAHTETVAAAAKANTELVMAIHAKVNTQLFTSQAAALAVLMIKGEALPDVMVEACAGASSTILVPSAAARPPLLPRLPTLQWAHHTPSNKSRSRPLARRVTIVVAIGLVLPGRPRGA
jgi:hypothetical protein